MRNQKALSCSQNSTPFMEPEGSSPHSQKPDTGHYPLPSEASQHPLKKFKITIMVTLISKHI